MNIIKTIKIVVAYQGVCNLFRKLFFFFFTKCKIFIGSRVGKGSYCQKKKQIILGPRHLFFFFKGKRRVSMQEMSKHIENFYIRVYLS